MSESFTKVDYDEVIKEMNASGMSKRDAKNAEKFFNSLLKNNATHVTDTCFK